MINVNGEEFRTLKDPIFVNGGNRVREVYANGTKVYPEDNVYGNLVKVTGNVSIKDKHTHDPSETGGYSDGWLILINYTGNFDRDVCEYSFDATFSAIVMSEDAYATTDDRRKGELILASKHKPEASAVRHVYLPSFYDGNIMTFNNFCKPFTSGTNHSPFGIKVNGTVVALKVMFHMSHVHMCQNLNYKTSVDSGYSRSYSLREQHPLGNWLSPGPNEYNMISIENVVGTWRQQSLGCPGATILVEWDGYGVKLRAENYVVNYRTRHYSTGSNFDTMGVSPSYSTDSCKTTFDLGYIPITKVLYDGPAEDSPAEMRYVSDSDLAKLM